MTTQSIDQYQGDGSTTQYAISFEFISRSHVQVSVGGVVQAAGTDYSFISDSLIELSQPTYLAIEIRRVTERDEPLVDFQDGSVLTGDNLDVGFQQCLYAVTEALDQGILDYQTLQAYVDELALYGVEGENQAWAFTGDGVTTEFTPSDPTPSHDNALYFIVSIDGALQRPVTDFQVDTTPKLIFTTAPADGAVISVQNFGVARALNSPADDSVTTQKIADGAVTSAKLAAGAGVTATGASSELSFADRAAQFISVKDFGATGDGVTDDTTAVQAAIAAAAGEQVLFPPGTYLVSSDLSISTDNTELVGHGAGSVLKLDGCKVHMDAVTKATHIFGCNIRDLKVQRIGTAGPAIHFEGQNSMGVARWNMHNVDIVSTGVGLQLEGSWIWDISNCVIAGCTSHGVEIVVAADGNSSANAGRFHGCEIQGNGGWGVYSETHNGIAFLGTSIEGNTGGGVNLRNNCRGTSFVGCYFELNGSAAGNRDLLVGDTSFSGTKTTGYSLGIFNTVFFDGGAANKDYAIELSRMQNVSIIGCQFNTHQVAGIYHNPEAANTVTGFHRNCQGTSGLATSAGDTKAFHADLTESAITHSATHDFASIADGASASQDFTVTGAAVGDFVMVSSGSSLQSLAMTAQVTAADTVRVTLHNSTGGAVDPANSTFRIVVIPKTLWF